MTFNNKVLVILGTRPEAIKLAPVITEIQKSQDLECLCLSTGQHRGLLDQVLDIFQITPDFDLDLMKPNQDLFYTSTECLNQLKSLIARLSPAMIVVQGDTTTAFASALAAFYSRVPLAHVEAGLRTYDKYSPFPEEMNRRLISALADLHFAPTEKAKANLIKESIAEGTIEVTGNTSIDALQIGLRRALPTKLKLNSPFILLTLHRRENFGKPLIDIFKAIKKFAQNHPQFEIVYPVHPNPNVRGKAYQEFYSIPNIKLVAPVDYGEMLYLLQHCQFILTDSGGIQEEAPSLGKPILVLRESTERPEAVEAGCAQLVGHNAELIYQMMLSLSDSKSLLYQSMAQSKNPYGDGKASQKIVKRIRSYLLQNQQETFSCAESSVISEMRSPLQYSSRG